MDLLSVHDIVSGEVNAQFLMGRLLSLSSLLCGGGGLSSLLLSLEFFLLSESVDWDLIGEGILKLLGGNLVLSGEEILDLGSALLEVICAVFWGGHLISGDGLSLLEGGESLLGIIIVVQLSTGENLTLRIRWSEVSDLEQELIDWSWLWVDVILEHQEGVLWHVLISSSIGSSLAKLEVVSLESHLGLLGGKSSLLLL